MNVDKRVVSRIARNTGAIIDQTPKHREKKCLSNFTWQALLYKNDSISVVNIIHASVEESLTTHQAQPASQFVQRHQEKMKSPPPPVLVLLTNLLGTRSIIISLQDCTTFLKLFPLHLTSHIPPQDNRYWYYYLDLCSEFPPCLGPASADFHHQHLLQLRPELPDLHRGQQHQPAPGQDRGSLLTDILPQQF